MNRFDCISQNGALIINSVPIQEPGQKYFSEKKLKDFQCCGPENGSLDISKWYSMCKLRSMWDVWMKKISLWISQNVAQNLRSGYF